MKRLFLRRHHIPKLLGLLARTARFLAAVPALKITDWLNLKVHHPLLTWTIAEQQRLMDQMHDLTVTVTRDDAETDDGVVVEIAHDNLPEMLEWLRTQTTDHFSMWPGPDDLEARFKALTKQSPLFVGVAFESPTDALMFKMRFG